MNKPVAERLQYGRVRILKQGGAKMTHDFKIWALGCLTGVLLTGVFLGGVLLGDNARGDLVGSIKPLIRHPDRPAGGSNPTSDGFCFICIVERDAPPEPPPSSARQKESVVPDEPSDSIRLRVPKAGNPTRNEPPLTSDAAEEGGDARVPRFNREAPGRSAGSVPECSPRATPHRDPRTRQPLHRTPFEPRCSEPRSWDGETNYGMHKEERK